MTTASQRPTFPRTGAPISVLLDFDGTISLEDVGDMLLERFAPDQAAVAEMDRRYDEGLVGSRELMRWDMDVLPDDSDALTSAAIAMPLDRTVVDLVEVVEAAGGVVEIVSDGLGFHVGPMLETIGLGRLPVATNLAVPGRGGEAVTFPFGHPACHVCGTCKRERVRLHRNEGRAVLFVGDGASDRYAAHHADVVFAKDALARYCDRERLGYVRWQRLSEVAAWVVEALGNGRLPADHASWAAWAAVHRSRPERFICGPEVWGGDAADRLLPLTGDAR
jgi:2,3-diketo-5-methylthio-1-phosphopentane phosphatase